jgi:hypothetical protein
MYYNNQVNTYGHDSTGSGFGPLAVSYEHGNAASSYVNAGEFLDYLRGYCFYSRIALLHEIVNLLVCVTVVTITIIWRNGSDVQNRNSVYCPA